MEQPKISTGKVEAEGRSFSAYLMEVENAVLAFFFEGESFRVGTLAIALPGSLKLSTQTTSSILVGYRNVNIARIAAEYLASKTGKIALASIFLKKEGG